MFRTKVVDDNRYFIKLVKGTLKSQPPSKSLIATDEISTLVK
jgi:hypothetical protein